MEDLKTKTQADIPAKDTLIYMRSNDANMAEIKTKMELIKQAVNNLADNTKDANDRNVEQHKEILRQLECMGDKFAEKGEFNFWRNVLIAGILVSIFLGIISLMLDKAI